jgi:hypothetical protein
VSGLFFALSLLGEWAGVRGGSAWLTLSAAPTFPAAARGEGVRP